MKNNLDILHIYSGTAGSASLYLKGIYDALGVKYAQRCFVNYYCPFDFGRKIFYKFTEMSGPNYLSKIPFVRYFVRYIELFFSLFFLFFYILFRKPKAVNYSLTSNLSLEYWFLNCVKFFTSSKLILTCHDVLPFENNFSNFEKDKANRVRFFNIADSLLVHNNNSRVELNSYFNISNEKIIEHLFPIMDLRELPIDSNKFRSSLSGNIFSFVGHMRKEKGVEALLDAWGKIDKSKNAKLYVVGNDPFGYAKNVTCGENLKVVDKFVSDIDYVEIISKSNFVVLPYERGTNSGIPSSIISMGAIPIASNIDMFVNNELLPRSIMFDISEPEALENKINYFINMTDSERLDLIDELDNRFIKYQDKFQTDIEEAYSSILENV
ncbi:Glycosyltransferase family 1 protein [Vibrio crassostreae]|nr:Glycosyltransferase family 1 protein [Vibrio crassostreae]CAK3448689.1 Glycosyltransferase family 1 protein [Vibrio crassostreae]